VPSEDKKAKKPPGVNGKKALIILRCKRKSYYRRIRT
jgi:hypothetical protein